MGILVSDSDSDKITLPGLMYPHSRDLLLRAEEEIWMVTGMSISIEDFVKYAIEWILDISEVPKGTHPMDGEPYPQSYYLPKKLFITPGIQIFVEGLKPQGSIEIAGGYSGFILQGKPREIEDDFCFTKKQIQEIVARTQNNI